MHAFLLFFENKTKTKTRDYIVFEFYALYNDSLLVFGFQGIRN